MAKKMPLRKCVGCGEMIAKKNMLRILKTTEGDIKLDPTGKENGRGAYLHFDKECFEKAVKLKGLERSFKMSIDPVIYEKLKKEMIDIEAK
ncbi:MAG: YlxR family protein [Lachnospiraceae bacterium]|nr:YlxR family protein [Lachnospiraceae bacterium]